VNTVQYLESLDSVRAGRRTDASGEDSTLVELQVFLEVLLTIALGRDVVVPQSYAFDSWTFLKVAEQVLEARDRGAPASGETPFRLHLYKADDFDDSVRKMLGRVHGSGTFFSSLLPELSDVDEAGILAFQSDLNAFVRWAPEDVRHALGRVRREFAEIDPVAARPREHAPTLKATVENLLNPAGGADAVVDELGSDDLRRVHRRLVSAVSALYEAAPGSFDQRSLLRSAKPWTVGTAGPSARALLDDDDALELTVEFVDTVYNRVLVDSIGRVPAAYTTSILVGGGLPLARQVAQRIALSDAASPAQVSGDGSPVFEIRTDAAALGEGKKLRRLITPLFEQGYKSLVPLFEARVEGGRRAKQNDFWTGVDAIQKAAARRDEDGVRSAQSAHLRYVHSVLSGGSRPGAMKEAGAVMLTTGSTGGLAEVVLSNGLFDVVVTGVGAAAGGAVLAAGQAGRRSWQRRRFAGALGNFVSVGVPAR
jgi:hypothetical protein